MSPLAKKHRNSIVWRVVCALCVWLVSVAAGAEQAEAPLHPNATVAKRMSLMLPDNRVQAMRSMSSYFPSRTISRQGFIHHFGYAPVAAESITYEWQGETFNLKDFSRRSYSTSLIVVHKSQLVHQQFLLGASDATIFTSYSMAKSMVGLLVGLAVQEGMIDSIEDPVTKYVPRLKGTGYDGATVKQLLQMSSGVAWNEKYTSPDSDINRFSRTTLIMNEMSANEFMAAVPRKHKPGRVFNYSTGETQVLGWVVSSAAGMSLSEFLYQKLWSRLGMEHDAYWLLDSNDGHEFCGIGLNAAARDYARIGQLMLQDGLWDGVRILPKGWVKASTTPAERHVGYGKLYESQPDLGYGYQWWVYRDGTFAAEGVFGQFIWIDPKSDMVIVKTSAWPSPTSLQLKQETLAVFRSISKYFSGG